jgi:hypothetical protein
MALKQGGQSTFRFSALFFLVLFFVQLLFTGSEVLQFSPPEVDDF